MYSTDRIIKNYTQIISHGEIGLRKDAIKIIEAGINGAHPAEGTYRAVRIDSSDLVVMNNRYPLKNINNIYVVGAGKASLPIAEVLEDILGEMITDGVIAVKQGEKQRLDRIRVYEAGHPLPDLASVTTAREIFSLVQKAQEDDIVFAVVTGGASSLTTLPPEDVGLNPIRQVSDLLLKSGAIIQNINIVRKHLCSLKGGKLIKCIQPATAITLTLDTAPADMPWPDMCLPDDSTFEDAVRVLKDHEIWLRIPDVVKQYLLKNIGNLEAETVKSFDGFKQILVNVSTVLKSTESAAEQSRILGYEPYILGTEIGGEAKDLGIFLAGMTREIIERGRPFKRPCALISSGETTVRVGNEMGRGGPNQETVLGYISASTPKGRSVCICVDTDGTDGPTQIAGGVADNQSLQRVKERKIQLEFALRRHNSSEVLQQLEDEVITEHTGTNMMNLRVVLIP